MNNHTRSELEWALRKLQDARDTVEALVDDGEYELEHLAGKIDDCVYETIQILESDND